MKLIIAKFALKEELIINQSVHANKINIKMHKVNVKSVTLIVLLVDLLQVKDLVKPELAESVNHN